MRKTIMKHALKTMLNEKKDMSEMSKPSEKQEPSEEKYEKKKAGKAIKGMVKKMTFKKPLTRY